MRDAGLIIGGNVLAAQGARMPETDLGLGRRSGASGVWKSYSLILHDCSRDRYRDRLNYSQVRGKAIRALDSFRPQPLQIRSVNDTK